MPSLRQQPLVVLCFYLVMKIRFLSNQRTHLLRAVSKDRYIRIYLSDDEQLHFWLLSLPCNLIFSKLREYDSVVSLKLKPILEQHQNSHDVLSHPAKMPNYLTHRVTYRYIVLIDEYFTDCDCRSNHTDTECSMRTRYRNQQ